jgi:hypothetical protein
VCIAQFDTAVVDGVINANEYGSDTDGHNRGTNNSINWYMTWNNDSLYVGISGADITEGFVIYIDHNPQVPVNVATPSFGSDSAFLYDDAFMYPPVKADFVAYVKNTYEEYRLDNGLGNWGGNTTGTLNVATSGSVIECAIPWSAITGGSRPSSFNWFGYKVSSSGGTVYGEVPMDNPEGNNTNGPGGETYLEAIRYYTVGSTANGSSTYPFANNSYATSRWDAGSKGFGDLSVYDFTLNNSSVTITKGNTNRFDIGNNMVLTAGTLSFGSSAFGNDDTIGNDLLIDTNANLQLSSSTANLFLGGDFVNRGDFDANGSIVYLNGSTKKQTLSGSLNDDNKFAQLAINNPQGAIYESADTLEVDDTMRLTLGVFEVASGGVFLMDSNSNFIPSGGDTNSFIDGTLEWVTQGTQERLFPVGDSLERGLVAITPENSVSGRSYRVRYRMVGYGSYAVATSSPQLDHVSVLEYWEIDPQGVSSASDSSARIRLHWSDYSAVSSLSSDIDSLRAVRFNGSVWEVVDTGQSITGSQDSGTIQTVFTSAFSPFTIGTLNANNLLPVTLINLELRENKLYWTTAQETNSSHWIVEGKDDLGWVAIGEEPAAGTSHLLTSYQYPIPLENYRCFRLVQVDFNGKQMVFDPLCVEQVQPDGWIYRDVSGLVRTKVKGEFELTALSAAGNEVFHGSNTTEINVKNWPPGIYIFLMEGQREYKYQRLLIH